jgi:hypothetical protein
MSSFWDDVSEPPDHLAARERGMTAREESIWEGSDGDMSINQIHNNVAEHNPSASTSQVQQMTVDLVRSLLSDGLFELSPKAVKEDASLEEWIDWIRSLYVEHFDEPTKWWSSIWLYVTDKGRREADRIEETYFADAKRACHVPGAESECNRGKSAVAHRDKLLNRQPKTTSAAPAPPPQARSGVHRSRSSCRELSWSRPSAPSAVSARVIMSAAVTTSALVQVAGGFPGGA